MTEIALRFSTGDAVIDRVLRGYIAAFQAAFPDRLRCFVIAGGYAEGTATPLSDIDGGPVFKSEPPLTNDEFFRANDLIRALSDVARIHLDAGAGSEDRSYQWREHGDIWASRQSVDQRYYSKLAYRVIWGEDFQEPILLPPFEYWVRSRFAAPPSFGGAPYFMAATRRSARLTLEEALPYWDGSDAPPLVHPLGYPDPDDCYYGYACHPLTARDGIVHRTTRLLVRTVLAIANALVAQEARLFVASKGDVAAAYREHVGGPWADFVEAVDRTCRIELQYLLPSDDAAVRRLRQLCRDIPAFESHLLERYRDFMLAEMATAEDERHPLSDGDWLPAELAGWLLERSPDDVQALGDSGHLPTQMEDGHRRFAARPCLLRWSAAMLSRVLFPGDQHVRDALRRLTAHPVEFVRQEAHSSLARQP